MIKKIKGRFQHYDWGGTEVLPKLFNENNIDNLPYAEYWMGDHPLLPSLLSDTSDALNTIVEKPLPFLTKILDVQNMLSIQIHPNQVIAEQGYRQEMKANIPLKSPQRIYKDPNEKEEALIVWSNDFRLLYGFMDMQDILNDLRRYDCPKNVVTSLEKCKDVKQCIKKVFSSNQVELNEAIKKWITLLKKSNQIDKQKHTYWALKAYEQFKDSSIEIQNGILFIFFHNLICLHKDESIYIKSGISHSYLEGLGYEIITNSDNVIRLGLTTKKVDVKQFTEVANFDKQNRITPKYGMNEQGINQLKYPTKTFGLDIIHRDVEQPRTTKGQELIFIKEGKGWIFDIDNNKPYEFEAKECFYLSHNSTYKIEFANTNQMQEMYNIYSLHGV